MTVPVVLFGSYLHWVVKGRALQPGRQSPGRGGLLRLGIHTLLRMRRLAVYTGISWTGSRRLQPCEVCGVQRQRVRVRGRPGVHVERVGLNDLAVKQNLVVIL